ncbi:MAG: TMEM14 family protein [Paludibacteraceae bacterium]|nr:TMEM14 family protein [Paludibacteraceae bacterium]
MKEKFDKNVLLVARIFFLLFSFVFLGICNGEFLYKMQNVSYFVFSDDLREEIVGQSGGLLTYLSSYLTQYLYYPLLGAAMLALLLSALEWLVAKLTHSPVFSFLVAGLVLLAQTSVGYAIYDNFRSPFIFSLVLGCLVAVLLSLAYQRLSGNKYAGYVVMAVASILYFFIGIYACVPILFVAVFALVKKEKLAVVKAVLGLLLTFLLPYIAANFVYFEDFSATVWSPVPLPYFLNIFVISLTVLVLLSLCPLFAERLQAMADRLSNKVWITYAAVLLLCVGIFFGSCRDADYHTELKLQRLAESHQWDEIIKEANKVEYPTKTIFVYRCIALSCKGLLASSMFNYPCTFKKVETNYVSEQPRYFEDIFLYASFLNNAYLWSMEFWCTTGYSYEHLKKMTICSLLNEEPTLADKYIQVLKQSTFQRQWALEYEEYVHDLGKMLKKYPEFAAVKSNLPTECHISTLDPLRKVYSQYSFLSPKNAERRLLADLWNRNMKTFLQDALPSRALYAHSDVPECIKEALVICAMQQGDPSILKGFKVTQQHVNLVQGFLNQLKKYSDQEEAKKALAKYRGHYCYFYVFANN